MTPGEADAQLAKAIFDHAEAHGLFDDPDAERFLSDFVIVANWELAENDGMDRYTRHFRNQTGTPTHTILGLLEVGMGATRWKS